MADFDPYGDSGTQGYFDSSMYQPEAFDPTKSEFDPNDPNSLLYHLGPGSSHPAMATMMATNPEMAATVFSKMGVPPPPSDMNPGAKFNPDQASAFDAIDKAMGTTRPTGAVAPTADTVLPPGQRETLGYAGGGINRPIYPGQDFNPAQAPGTGAAAVGPTPVKPVIVTPPAPGGINAAPAPAATPATPAPAPPDIPAPPAATTPDQPVVQTPAPVNAAPPKPEEKKAEDKVEKAADSFTKALQALHAVKPPEVQKVSSPAGPHPTQRISGPDLQQLLAMFRVNAPTQLQRRGLAEQMGIRV